MFSGYIWFSAAEQQLVCVDEAMGPCCSGLDFVLDSIWVEFRIIFRLVDSKGVVCVIILAGPLWGPARHRALLVGGGYLKFSGASLAGLF